MTRAMRAGVSSLLEGSTQSRFSSNLPHDAGPVGRRVVVELFLQLVLDQRPFLLDDKDLFQAIGEGAHAGGLQRPGHADLVDPQPDLGGKSLVDAQILKRLADVEIGFAGGHDPEPRLGAVEDHLVETVVPRERQGGVELVLMEPMLLLQPLVRPADRETPSGISKSGRPISTRCGSTVIEAELSMISAVVLKPTHSPENRDMAKP